MQVCVPVRRSLGNFLLHDDDPMYDDMTAPNASPPLSISSSTSSNDTAPNLVGPGRVLGNFYDRAGRYVEKALGKTLNRAGRGPYAKYKKIEQIYATDWRVNVSKSETYLLHQHF